VVEYNLPQFSFRGAISAVPTVANGPELEFHCGKAAGYTFESEYRNSLIGGHPGAIRALVFENQTKAGNYNNALEAYENGTDTTLNVNSLSNYGGSKIGLNINVEQEIVSGLGAFLRLSWNDGHFASWAFTEIDRSLGMGINLSGSKWKRGNDDIGLAISINGISNDHQRFLEAGGLGFIIGDGKLIHYKTENILEMYYQAKIVTSVFASADYQLIGNPAYNGDRGPVNVFSARVHVEL
jgi:high affinity Mn2+ porin